MDVIVKETDFNNVIGTSFHNKTINASVNELISIFGIEPDKDFDYKTKFEWRLEYHEYHDETLNKQFPFTIYDYKEDWDQYEDNSIDNDYLYTTKIDWHIGSKSYDYAILVQDWLKNELNKLRNEG